MYLDCSVISSLNWSCSDHTLMIRRTILSSQSSSAPVIISRPEHSAPVPPGERHLAHTVHVHVQPVQPVHTSQSYPGHSTVSTEQAKYLLIMLEL